MEDALRFVREYEVYIYLILGVVAAWYLRKFMLSWRDLREAAFGLERETSQARLNWSASVLVFVLILGVVEFALVSYVVPTVPGAAPLFTPTLDLLATPTVTLNPSNPQGAANPTPASTLLPGENGCIAAQVDITSPTAGSTVQGDIEIIGTADTPNFGFYKYETTSVNDLTWLTIQAGNTAVNNDVLGHWDTARLTPGDYFLRLVVTDNTGQPLMPCIIQLRVEAPPPE